jgi:adenylyl- and sulfurtransferase ThiI
LERERLKTEREEMKKKIKDKIQKDLEDIGNWKNIETIENNLAKMKTKKEKTAALKQLHSCSSCLPITFLGLSFIDCIS